MILKISFVFKKEVCAQSDKKLFEQFLFSLNGYTAWDISWHMEAEDAEVANNWLVPVFSGSELAQFHCKRIVYFQKK